MPSAETIRDADAQSLEVLGNWIRQKKMKEESGNRRSSFQELVSRNNAKIQCTIHRSKPLATLPVSPVEKIVKDETAYGDERFEWRGAKHTTKPTQKHVVVGTVVRRKTVTATEFSKLGPWCF